MKKNFIFSILLGLIGMLFVAGCGPEDGEPSDNNDTGGDGDTDGDSDGDTDSDTDSDADGDSDAVCALNELETFDTEIPTGWTVISGGSGSGSATGSTSGTVSTDVNPENTWHHTTVDTSTSSKAGMEGGYMEVGGKNGLNEALITPIYTRGSCDTVTLTFTHYFDDLSINADDKGALWFIGDSGSWESIAEYDSNPDKLPSDETVDLSTLTLGQSTFQLKFVFSDNNAGNYGWGIDNVQVTGAK